MLRQITLWKIVSWTDIKYFLWKVHSIYLHTLQSITNFTIFFNLLLIIDAFSIQMTKWLAIWKIIESPYVYHLHMSTDFSADFWVSRMIFVQFPKKPMTIGIFHMFPDTRWCFWPSPVLVKIAVFNGFYKEVKFSKSLVFIALFAT